MTSNYITPLREAGDQYLETVTKVQDATLDALSTVTGAVSSLTASLPDAVKTVPGLPETDLPTPQEVSAIYFEYAEKLLASQKAYMEKFFAATKS